MWPRFFVFARRHLYWRLAAVSEVNTIPISMGNDLVLCLVCGGRAALSLPVAAEMMFRRGDRERAAQIGAIQLLVSTVVA